MKKIFLASALCFICRASFAQVFIANLVMDSNPPASLIDWGPTALTYIISPSPLIREAVIKADLKTVSGEQVASTYLPKAKRITVGATNIILFAADVIPLEIMIFSGKFKSSIERTGKLPAGDYRLCVQLVTPVDFLQLSEERCRNFTLASFQLPIPMIPPNEEVIESEKAQTAIIFRWTPVTPRPKQPLLYVLTIFEVLDKQTPMQALRSNQPLLTKEIMGTTQYIWQPQLSFIKTKIWKDERDGDNQTEHSRDPHVTGNDPHIIDSIYATQFIWTIQTLDTRHVPFGDGNVNGDGISEPSVFTVIKDGRKNRSGEPARTIYLKAISH